MMNRQSALGSPAVSLWASVESALRLTLRTLQASASQSEALAALEGEQSRIRRSGRYWLLG